MKKLKLHPFFHHNKIAFLSLSTIIVSVIVVNFINSFQLPSIYSTQTAKCSGYIDPEEKKLCKKQV
ncbi:MAG: hypothetical protein U0946_01515 [Patescibacteria group bacterium]|nr:hypothetical protein [Patescibacteria group bacterium]